MNNQYLLLFVLLLCCARLEAQDQGSTFIRNYTPKEYREFARNATPENHALLEDEQGLMYISNNAGLMEFDGVDWKLLPYGDIKDMRSIAKASDGRISVGGRGALGVFNLTEDGDYRYHDLTNQLKKDSANDLTFWHTYLENDQLHFISYVMAPLRVYRLEGDTLNLIKEVQLDIQQKRIDQVRFYRVDGKLYGFIAGKGFCILKEDDTWQVFKGSEEWPSNPGIYNAMLLNDRTLLAMTFTGNIYEVDLTHQQPVKPWASPIATYAKENQLLNILTLSNGNLAFCTVKGGVAITSPKGDILQIINKKNGLQDNIVFTAKEDQQNGLWLALFNGVSRVELNSSLRFWGEDLGLDGRIMSVNKLGEYIIVNTVLGSFYLKDGRFHKIPNAPIEASDIFPFYPNGNKEEAILLFSGIGGVHTCTLDENNLPSIQQVTRKLGRAGGFSFSKSFPNRVYFSSAAEGLAFIDYQDGKWSEPRTLRLNGERLDAKIVIENTPGDLWLLLYTNTKAKPSIIRAKIDPVTLETISVTPYDTTDYNTSDVYWIDSRLDTVILLTNKGLVFYDEATSNFLPYTGLGKDFAQSESAKHLMEHLDKETGNVWVSLVDADGTPTGQLGIYRRQRDGSYELDATSLIRLSGTRLSSRPYVDGEYVWIPATDVVYRFESQSMAKEFTPYQSIIKKVIAGTDSVLFNGHHILKEETGNIHASSGQVTIPSLVYDENTVKIEFGALFFEAAEALQYSYQLKNDDGDEKWTPWAKEDKVVFNNLREGEYSFQVRALNIYGQESLVASYNFEILPPWQRTTLAYVSYAIAVLFLIWLVVRLNGLRLKKHNEMLTRLVQERTHEIQGKNEELRSQQEEILSQSENIKQAHEEILAINETLQDQNEEVEQTNYMLNNQKGQLEKALGQITDSVRYAERIQRAILGEAENIVTGFKDGFIFFQPRDIVSGDFYWYSEVKGKKIVIAADCTGHGVPGAFMTVMGNSLLHQIINEGEIICPSQILSELDRRISSTLGASKSNSKSLHDGMDVAIAVFDDAKQEIQFAGAKNPMIMMRGNECTVVKGSKFPIGSAQFKVEKVFDVHTLSYQKGDKFYLFSDGFQDQFGGEQDTKYLKKRFRGLIESHHFLPMNDQKEKLDSEFRHWKGNKSQTDDILVIGLEVG